MATLKNRQLSIPGGLKFYQPEVNWDAAKVAGTQPSFDRLVQAVITMRQGNHSMLAKYSWSIDADQVANEVDAFNARMCQQMGWGDYIAEGGVAAAPPFQSHSPSLFARSARLVAGGKTLLDWLKSGAEAVAPGLAASRASVCATCPHNEQGDITSFFTSPVSEAIREALNQRRGWNLSTPSDDKLGVCQICACPLRLKTWLPIEAIQKRLPADVRAELPSYCWMVQEQKS